MAGYASAKPCAAVSMQAAMLSFVSGVVLYSKYLIKGNALSHTHITHSHICSHGNSDIITVIKKPNCYQSILVYLAMSHRRMVASSSY